MRRSSGLLLCFLFVTLLLLAESNAQSTPAPTPTIEPEPLNLVIWLPDLLVRPDQPAILETLQRQTDEFIESREEPVTITLRLRRVGTTGGIMSTLRTALDVAPGAIPSLTLLRRSDLVTAERSGLIESMEGLVPSAIQGQLNTALQLGRVNDELYAVPYTLELDHIVYHTDNSDIGFDDWLYDDVLQREQPYVFPSGRIGGLSDVFLLQYVASGGTLSRTGTLTLNPSALRSTLEYYESAVERGIISEAVLEYIASSQYLSDFMAGDYPAAVFRSTEYLAMVQDNSDLAIAPIPTAAGDAATVLNGWMWTLTTDDPDLQTLSIDYITWLMDPERQATFAQVARVLPSQQAALTRGIAGGVPVEPYLQLLDGPVLPVTESDGGALGRAMQDALFAVIRQEQTAEQATTTVLDQQADS